MAYDLNLAIVPYVPWSEPLPLVERFFGLIHSVSKTVMDAFDLVVRTISKVAVFSATIATTLNYPTKITVCPYVAKLARKIVCLSFALSCKYLILIILVKVYSSLFLS